MDKNTMLTIIRALVKALDNETMMREYYEKRVKELEGKEQTENG